MNIELIKAILHVLDPAVDAPILSEAILPPSEDALQYLAGHAAKCFASDEAKACTLADDSPFLPLFHSLDAASISRMILKKRRLSLPETGSV